MRALAMSKGELPSFRCGPYEVLRVAYAAPVHIEKINAESNIVLKGLRRNGMLSYRPDLTQRCLKRADEEKWTQGLPLGSHRYPERWLTDRFAWMTETGEPLEPEFRKCGKGVSRLEDMQDFEPNGPEGCKVQLSTWQGAMWQGAPELAQGFELPYLSIEADGEDLDAAVVAELAEELRTAVCEEALARLAGHMGGCAVSKGQARKTAYRRNRRQERKFLRIGNGPTGC